MALWDQATPEVSSEKPQPIPPGLTPTPTPDRTDTDPAPTRWCRHQGKRTNGSPRVGIWPGRHYRRQDRRRRRHSHRR